MTRTFFSGGVMPVHGWLGRVGSTLREDELWWLSGEHYARTARAWLTNFDGHRDEILAVFARRYGRDAAVARAREWRLFFVATEEIFAIRGGREYGVSHQLLRHT